MAGQALNLPIALIVFLLLALLSCEDRSAISREEYDAIRDEITPRLLTWDLIDWSMRQEIDSILDAWQTTEESPGLTERKALASLLENETFVPINLGQNTVGLLTLMCSVVPEFSEFSPAGNQRMADFMRVQATVLPSASDGKIYFDNDLAMVRTSESKVVIYKVTQDGIESWVYYRGD
ncbi:MAG: hypothetical protein AAF911_11110 [Planctomycetota bacterium]